MILRQVEAAYSVSHSLGKTRSFVLGLIEEAGSDNESQAVLYKTTPYFLERVGIANLEELPPVADYLPNMAALDSIIDESII